MHCPVNIPVNKSMDMDTCKDMCTDTCMDMGRAMCTDMYAGMAGVEGAEISGLYAKAIIIDQSHVYGPAYRHAWTCASTCASMCASIHASICASMCPYLAQWIDLKVGGSSSPPIIVAPFEIRSSPPSKFF